MRQDLGSTHLHRITFNISTVTPDSTHPYFAALKYEDVHDFCRAVTLDEIRKHGRTLTLGRYVSAEAGGADGESFDEKMLRLTAGLVFNG